MIAPHLTAEHAEFLSAISVVRFILSYARALRSMVPMYATNARIISVPTLSIIFFIFVHRLKGIYCGCI